MAGRAPQPHARVEGFIPEWAGQASLAECPESRERTSLKGPNFLHSP